MPIKTPKKLLDEKIKYKFGFFGGVFLFGHPEGDDGHETMKSSHEGSPGVFTRPAMGVDVGAGVGKGEICGIRPGTGHWASADGIMHRWPARIT